MPSAELDSPHPDTQRALRTLAEEAARAGGSVARRYFGTDFGIRLKQDRSEVSDADEAAQAAVVAVVRASRPQDAFITEEPLHLPAPHVAPANDQLCWVIDPIDGTRNFIRRLPFYTCSVAALLGGLPLVGAIHDPVRDVMYSASRVGGLFVNGEHQPVDRAVMARPPGINPKPLVALPSTPTRRTSARAHEWLDRYVCRSLGSTALHLAMVATGQLDATLCDNPRLWDLAAGWLLVTAAGRGMTAPDGAPLFPLDVSRYTGEEMPFIAADAEFPQT